MGGSCNNKITNMIINNEDNFPPRLMFKITMCVYYYPNRITGSNPPKYMHALTCPQEQLSVLARELGPHEIL